MSTSQWSYELVRSWPSLLVAVFATAGYVLIGRKRAVGWLANFIANLALALTGVLAHQWGLLQSLVFAGLALWNFFAWRRSPPTD